MLNIYQLVLSFSSDSVSPWNISAPWGTESFHEVTADSMRKPLIRKSGTWGFRAGSAKLGSLTGKPTRLLVGS